MSDSTWDRPAPWRLEVGFVCDPGLQRDRNEDACSVFVPYQGEEDRFPVGGLFVVADGMGGHDAGDIASRYVTDAVVGTFVPSTPTPMALPIPGTIEDLIRRLHRELRDMAVERGAERGMGSTLALAVLEGDLLHVASIGDSRCYRLRDRQLERLTRDQSWVAEQVRSGLMSEEEAREHPNRNVLTQCLGIGATPPVEVRQEVVKAGDRYLLCSDGLHGQVPDDVIARVLAEESPQDAARQLTAFANRAGGPDNISVVVVHAQSPRMAELAITLTGEPLPSETAETPARSPRWNRLSLGLFAAGVLLLVGALGALIWLGPPRPASATAQPAAVSPGSPRGPAPDSVSPAPAGTPVDSPPTHPEPRGNPQ